jgi:hypothetical protein
MTSAGASGKSTPKRRFIRIAVAGCGALLVTGLLAPAGAQTRRELSRSELVASRPAGTPLMAIIALRNQRITIYDAKGWILRAPVSSGQTGYETPAGIYSVIQKEAQHYSNLYDDASMPFMQRITWSGIALHAGALPGYAASHGCVRMPYEFAKLLFDMTKIGTRVIVGRNDVSPVEISHPALFKPRPVDAGMAVAQVENHDGGREQTPSSEPAAAAPTSHMPLLAQHLETLKSIAAAKSAQAEAAAKKVDELRLAAARKAVEAGRATMAIRVAEIAKFRADAQLNAAQNALENAHSPEAIQLVEAAKANALTKIADAEAQLAAAKVDVQPKAEAAARASEEVKAAEAEKVAALEAAHEATRKSSPVSVFISRKTQRLYVRQAFQPVFETPVTIRDADQPIGTHIFTALDYTREGTDVRWSVVSMNATRYGRQGSTRNGWRRARDHHEGSIATDPSAATTALDRISIPQDALDRLSEVVAPGSSLIISDESLSNETGNGTDFVILMSGEPQGGISMRHRELETE